MEKERVKGKGLDALPPMFLVEEHAGNTVLIIGTDLSATSQND